MHRNPPGDVTRVVAGSLPGAIRGNAPGCGKPVRAIDDGVAVVGGAPAAGPESVVQIADSMCPQLTELQRREALEFGMQVRRRLGRGAEWSDVESTLRNHWSRSERLNRVSWVRARDAVHDGWQREGQ
jgi:hypothetical protein